jgi:putative membrane protein
MRGLVIRWLTLTVAIVATSYLLEGIRISGFGAALAAAAVLGILNAFFRPLAILLTLPINILSLGLFTFIINALVIKIVSGLIPGFDVIGFWTAVIGALVISLISWLLSAFIGPTGRVDSFAHQRRSHRHHHPPDGRTIDLEDKGDGRWE